MFWQAPILVARAPSLLNPTHHTKAAANENAAAVVAVQLPGFAEDWLESCVPLYEWAEGSDQSEAVENRQAVALVNKAEEGRSCRENFRDCGNLENANHR